MEISFIMYSADEEGSKHGTAGCVLAQELKQYAN